MNSPTHKANIVNSKYQEIGIGVVNGVLNGVKTTLVVQHFGTPVSGQVSAKSAQPPVAVTDSQVLSDVSSAPKAMISPLQISQVVGSIMFTVLIATLSIDAYVTLKNKTHRLSSNTFGHIGFIAIIFILLVATRSGAIF